MECGSPVFIRSVVEFRDEFSIKFEINRMGGKKRLTFEYWTNFPHTNRTLSNGLT